MNSERLAFYLRELKADKSAYAKARDDDTRAFFKGCIEDDRANIRLAWKKEA